MNPLCRSCTNRRDDPDEPCAAHHDPNLTGADCLDYHGPRPAKDEPEDWD
mgnify:CR=1 FL=1